MANFTVYDNGRILTGAPKTILEAIRQRAAENVQEVRDIDVATYAGFLIEDAEYFLDERLLKAMENVSFNDDFERALTYMAHMPTSGVRIMTVRAA